MMQRRDVSLPALDAVLAFIAIPGSLLSGFFIGLVAPVAAIAGMVAGIRLATGKVPFLGHIWEGEDGERHLSFKLASPDEAQELYSEHKERFSDELGPMKAEIRAIMEEARASAQGEAAEGSAEAPPEE